MRRSWLHDTSAFKLLSEAGQKYTALGRKRRSLYLAYRASEANREGSGKDAWEPFSVQLRKSEECTRQIDEALCALRYREREVVKMRFKLGYGEDEFRTLEEIGKVFRVTRERVRQIIVRAVAAKLNDPVSLQRLSSLIDFLATQEV